MAVQLCLCCSVCAVSSGATAPANKHKTTKPGSKRWIQRAAFPLYIRSLDVKSTRLVIKSWKICKGIHKDGPSERLILSCQVQEWKINNALFNAKPALTLRPVSTCILMFKWEKKSGFLSHLFYTGLHGTLLQPVTLKPKAILLFLHPAE